jgi:NAD(P)-dependent dehydrogenase (short-subunit alcohol dehydrogenase family)
MELKGKVAIVTGGALGIGLGIVNCMAEEGADVAILDINRDAADEAASLIKASGRRSLSIETDATDNQQVKKAIEQVIASFGKIDILVNNVGGEARFYYGGEGRNFLEITETEWDKNLDLNLKSTIIVCKAVAPHFVEQRSGKIVNIASIAGWPPSGRAGGLSSTVLASYAVAKAGVIQFTGVLALEMAEFNINVNCVCPGVIYTPLYEMSAPRRIRSTPGAEGMTAMEYFDKYIAPKVPLKRGQTPEDIGRAVVFLVSEDARNITGQSINVDGGMVPR